MTKGKTSRTKGIADHARSRLKLIRLIIAHVRAKSHATSAMDRSEAKKKEPRSESTAKKREDCPTFTAGPWFGRSQSQRRKVDCQQPENKKTVAKQAFYPPARYCGSFDLMLHRPHIYILVDARRNVPRFSPE
jgi:hypothetical protein